MVRRAPLTALGYVLAISRIERSPATILEGVAISGLSRQTSVWMRGAYHTATDSAEVRR